MADYFGTNLGETVRGGSGNDRVFGLGGDDFLIGWDSVSGPGGTDSLFGGDGNDTLYVGDSPGGVSDLTLTGELYDGGAGHDVFHFNVDNYTGSAYWDWSAMGVQFVAVEELRVGFNGGSNATNLISIDRSDFHFARVDGGGFNNAPQNHNITVQIQVETASTDLSSVEIVNFRGLEDNSFQVKGRSQDDLIRGPGGEGARIYGEGGNDTLIGGPGQDYLFGGPGHDRLHGEAGDDILLGDEGDDIVEGGLGDDTIFAGAGFDLASYASAPGAVVVDLAITSGGSTSGAAGSDHLGSDIEGIIGSAFDDMLYGDENANRLEGGGGFDVFRGRGGNDTFDGGAGNDLANYSQATAAVTVDLDAGSASGGDGNDLLISIEQAVGTNFDDILSGSTGDDSFFGLDGNDTIEGRGGNDVIYAGNGFNDVFGGAGNDSIQGGADSETLRGSTSTDASGTVDQDSIEAGGGADAIYGSNGNDTLRGQDGNDFIRGHRGNDVIDGGAGSDTASYRYASGGVTVNLATGLAGGADGADTLSDIENVNGGDHNDTLTGSTGSNELYGQDGNDVLFASDDPNGNNSTAPDTMGGGNGDDLLFGSAGGDNLSGGAHDDHLSGNRGDDTIDGGTGRDIASYVAANGGVSVDLMTNSASGADGNDTLTSIEDVWGSNTYDDTLSGNAEDNLLLGNGGNDQLSGRGGDDELYGGGGDDTLDGGTGNDALDGESGDDRFNVTPVAGETKTVEGGDGIDLLRVLGTDSSAASFAPGTNSLILTTGGATITVMNDVESIEFDDRTLTYAEAMAMTPGARVHQFALDGAQANAGAGTGSAATGTGYGIFDPATGALTYSLTVDGLDLGTLLPGFPTRATAATGDDVTAAHIHTGARGANGGVAFGFLNDDDLTATLNADGSWTMSGVWESSEGIDPFASAFGTTPPGTDLDLYFNLHTTSFGGGEIRGQIVSSADVSANSVTGTSGNDTLLGLGGDDTLAGVLGDDSLRGGDGTDTAAFGVASSTVTVQSASQGLRLTSAEGEDFVGDDIERLQFTDRTLTYAEAMAMATPTFTGDDTANLLTGTSAAELFNAGGGNDWINSGGGNDTVNGEGGIDMLSLYNLPDTPGRSNTDYRMDIDMAAGTGVNHDGSETVTFSGIERLTATIFADRIRGTDGNDEIRGLGDYDWIIATPGSDTIDGGTGQDMLSFVEFTSTAGNVIADIFSSNGLPPSGTQASGLVVDLANPANNTGLAAGLDLTSIERITGSGRQDVFFGDAGQNDFRGLGDYDWFVSSEGGRERYFGGDGVDTVTYYNASAGVVANLSNGARVNGQETGYGSGGVAARDLYFEIENLVGSRFDDELRGSSGRNQLNGLEGDDFLFGYAGVDYLKGGLGDDVIDGGSGSDYALFNGNSGDYTLTRAGDNVTVTGADGIDRLIDVEYFRFEDMTVDIWSL
ncbi:CHRD domain-containing protein [Marinovum sp.]|uniref:CHRD domain-containing protein n=1 Tax=Marinovum sp. TaxID=2024839 RepID=UPI003A9587DB